ncbi:MAG TPA: lysophospholipid acyltransferase family protein [Longimicrobium sp.]|jgi:1-acyl-sn-glycerol-3-phosphate acyltransferase|uniref:lysophospholipid acyltransferase family protein n=1 Tax=Longimicrobium sp. TaxID=2029185 RepID=UPI002ED98727
MIYRLFRALWRAALFAFFRRVDVQGRERVPVRGPVLLVSNHANAFVDPLLMITALRRPVSLTAKSTLRRNPLLAPLIRALNVIEFHRGQDRAEGADPSRNVDAMAACRRRLAEGGAVCIFPEGVSHSDPALRPFRTGAARIALDYLAQASPGATLSIVPVGLHYEEKERFRSAAGVVFGAPLDAAAWVRDHPGADAGALTDEMERGIRALTANFATEHEVATFARAEALWDAAAAPPAPLDRAEPVDIALRLQRIHRLQDGRGWLARKRSAELAALERRVDEMHGRLRELGVSPAELFLPIDAGRAAFFVLREAEVMLIGAPLAAWGALNHAPIFLTLRTLVRRMSKDRDHVASNAVFLGLPIVPAFYALQITVAALLLPALWTLVYAASLPFTAAVALLYADRAGGVMRRVRTFLLFARRPEHQRRLRADALAIVEELRRLDAELREREGG